VTIDLARRVELIRADSEALAVAARRDLGAPVPSCPEWSVGDLVRHVFQVHRSWARIVGEQIMTPDWVDAPYPPDDELVDAFVANANRMADVFAATDPASPCWTWGPEHNAGFVQRFQVQEVALHRWDAELATGTPRPIATDGAADAVALMVELVPLRATTAPQTIRLEADDVDLDLTMFDGRSTSATLRGSASDLLLVLWGRVPLETVAVDGDRAAVRATLDAIQRE
jgi:uncharacterized protein (TIGR03083 family)